MGIAVAIEQEAAGRFHAVARDMQLRDRPDVAQALNELATEHGIHAAVLAGRTPEEGQSETDAIRMPQLWPWLFSGSEDCILAETTPYQALAFAVDVARRTFELFSYLAMSDETSVRECAEGLAKAALARAAELRGRRREAYHREQQSTAGNGFPLPQRVESLSDLLTAAKTIDAQIAREFATLERTDAKSPQDRLADLRRLLTVCERAFVFYDAVVSGAVDERVMLQAQEMSGIALDRIAAVRARFPSEAAP